MTGSCKVEKFSATELVNLRTELMQSGIDSWQAAEVLRDFLAGHGYGVNAEGARDAVTRLESAGRDLGFLQKELERVAFVM
ncbi:MAG TPA: hypothetical protein VGR96_07385 [Acidobacteriaceae bacterium]|nr:hypothetical protein [Acidobacteriaceae bacterium]